MTSNLNRASPPQALGLHFQRTPCQLNVSCRHASLGVRPARRESVAAQYDRFLSALAERAAPGSRAPRGQPLIRLLGAVLAEQHDAGSTGTTSPWPVPQEPARRHHRRNGYVRPTAAQSVENRFMGAPTSATAAIPDQAAHRRRTSPPNAQNADNALPAGSSAHRANDPADASDPAAPAPGVEVPSPPSGARSCCARMPGS